MLRHCFAMILQQRLFVLHLGPTEVVGTVHVLQPVGPPTGDYVLATVAVLLIGLDFAVSSPQSGGTDWRHVTAPLLNLSQQTAELHLN